MKIIAKFIVGVVAATAALFAPSVALAEYPPQTSGNETPSVVELVEPPVWNSSDDELAATGSGSAVPLTLAAAGALVAGAGLVLFARRRRTDS